MKEEAKKVEKKKAREINGESNNALSVGRMIENAEDNIREAEISMEFADDEERENLEEKNEHRQHAIDKMKKQLRDEAAFATRKKSFE